jgi:hypothetical protein
MPENTGATQMTHDR